MEKRKSADKHTVFGLHAVQALLEHTPEKIQSLFIAQDRHDQRMQKIIALAKQRKISLLPLKKDQYQQNHQGVVAICDAPKANIDIDLPTLFENLQEPPLLLILDGVQDPHNLGACLRTANAAGVHAVIIPKDRAAPLNTTVRKVASGAAEITPLITVTNLVRTLEYLKEQGVWLYGMAGEAKKSLYEFDFKTPIAFVLGSEGEGLRRLTREHCDELLSIPMDGEVSSLNVSVATGVCLFEAVRQRMFSKH
jgi:23S rRNA (guanosine2251-2'-O)-methyltransferase